MFRKILESKIILVILFIALALLWGLSFVFIKKSLVYLEPIELLSIRWAIAVAFFLLLRLMNLIKLNYKNKPIKKLLPLVLCQPIVYSFLEALGVSYSTASESAVIIAALPFMVLLLGIIILGRRPNAGAVTGMVIGFGGVVLTIVLGPMFSVEGNYKGYVFLLLAITVGAIYSLLASELTSIFSPIEITFAMAVSAGVTYNAVNLFGGNLVHTYVTFINTPVLIWAGLFLGVGCACLGFLICNYTLSRMDASIATAIQCNAINIVGVVSGIVINDDPWGWYTILGVLLMTIGIVYVSANKEK